MDTRVSGFAEANQDKKYARKAIFLILVGDEGWICLRQIHTSGRQLGKRKASFSFSLASYRRRTLRVLAPLIELVIRD